MRRPRPLPALARLSPTARRAATVLAVALVLGLAVVPAVTADDDTPELVVKITGSVEASPVGDLDMRLSIAWPAEVFAKIHEKLPDARRFLQDMAPNRASAESVDAQAAYDEPQHAVVLTLTQRGLVKNAGGGRWTYVLDGDTTLVKTTPEGAEKPAAWFRETGRWDDGTKYEAEYSYALPPGATQARWDAATRTLSWRLAPTAKAEPPHVTLDLRVRERLMSTIYKVYGIGANATQLYWVAKSVLRNEGGTARNLRIRYRLQGYGEWSPWEKLGEMAPGQTVVNAHYPVLDASIAKLRSNTPANLMVEYTYEDAAGKRYDDDDARRIVVLGVNEFVFGNLTAGESFGTWQEEYNNAPLLAAWVTRNDPVIKQFASMANRMAGGVGASTDNASAVKVLRACYELLQRNDFSYQHPPSLSDKSVSFDPKSVQNVKLPRETIRDRSGTCIDLAILYAAMVNAVGLEPHLALIPGHCFPVIRLPDGKLYAVEATGVQGGLRTGSAPFDRVFEFGLEELKKSMADGRIYLLDLHELWGKGIANPEIEDMPADILQRWGISEEGRGTPTGPTAGPDTPAVRTLDAVLGTWGGIIPEGKIDDELRLDAMLVGLERNDAGVYRAGVRMEFTVTKDGRTVAVVANGIYEDGRVDGNAVRFPGATLKRTPAGGETSEFQANPLVVQPTDDGRIAATLEGEGGFAVTLAKKAEDAPETPAAPEASPLDAVAGSWGGNMSGADIGSGVRLDEMYVDAAAAADGTWTAKVVMKMRVTSKGNLAITVDANYAGGRIADGAVRFAKVPWHRTVPSTGKRDDLDGNPLVLKIKPDGGLDGLFEGSDGMPFGLLRRGPAPAPRPAKGPLDDLVGPWGGDLGNAALNEQMTIQDAFLDLGRTASGGWSAALRMSFHVHTAQGDVLVIAEGPYPEGHLDGDAIKFPATQVTRTVPSTGAKSPMDANALEVRREPDGRLELKLVGEGGFTLTLARRR